MGETIPSTVLFFYSDAQNPFSWELEKHLKKILEEKGLLLLPLEVNGRNKVCLLEQILPEHSNICGALISMDVSGEVEQEFLQNFSIPKVIIGNRIPGLVCDRVFSGNCEGAYKATVHLIRSGHEQIALLCGDSRSESNLERIAGYRKALLDNQIHIEDKFAVMDLKEEKDTVLALNTLLSRKNVPSAIFVANSKTVLSVFRYISRNSLECPRDISVVGFNDFEWAPLVLPPLTTVRQNMGLLCQKACGILLEHMEEQKDGRAGENRKIEVATELCVRGSTCGIGRGPFGEKAADIGLLQMDEAA